MNFKEIRAEIYGRVQGVGFRDFIKSNAEKLGLKGFVKNNSDGSLLLVAQGDEKAVGELINLAHKGSFFSSISGMSYVFAEPKEKFEDFRIAREGGFISDQKKSFSQLGKTLLGLASPEEKPKHIAIIPDGNRRWAQEKGFESIKGIQRSGSYTHLKELFEVAKKENVKYFSLWGFSTENWKRPQKEIDAVFELISRDIEKFRQDAFKDNIRFRHIGRKDRIPNKFIDALNKLEDETKNFDNFNVQLCLDYGGKDEIVRAVNKIIKEGKTKIDEKMFSQYLDSSGIPEPDLIIRTSGEKRLSGFMPFQSDYAELYFCDKYFPDFNAEDLTKAVKIYGMRKRRFGK